MYGYIDKNRWMDGQINRQTDTCHEFYYITLHNSTLHNTTYICTQYTCMHTHCTHTNLYTYMHTYVRACVCVCGSHF